MQKKRFLYDAAELSGKVGEAGARIAKELCKLPQGELHDKMLKLYLTIMDTQRDLMRMAMDPQPVDYSTLWVDEKTGTMRERRDECENDWK